MNFALLNNASNKQANTIRQGKLPLWFIVLFIVALTLILSSLTAYFSQQHSRNDALKSQMSGLLQQKTELLQQPDIINTNWLRTLNILMKDVQGGVIWSSEKQQGIVYFQNLPKSAKNQQYRLWVYDLSMVANKRVSAAKFTRKIKGGSEYLVAIKPDVSLKLPYKFELVLEDLGAENQPLNEHPLLLAQP